MKIRITVITPVGEYSSVEAECTEEQLETTQNMLESELNYLQLKCSNTYGGEDIVYINKKTLSNSVVKLEVNHE